MDRHGIAGSLVVLAAKHRRYAVDYHALAARCRAVGRSTDDIDASMAIAELCAALDSAAELVAMRGDAEALVRDLLKP